MKLSFDNWFDLIGNNKQGRRIGKEKTIGYIRADTTRRLDVRVDQFFRYDIIGSRFKNKFF
jgi:hypothetical protein